MRVALVGLGNAAQTLHLPALAGLTGITVVAACDPDERRRTEASSRWHLATFPTFDLLAAHAHPDLVIICTPPDTHADYCLRSLAIGADVLCEKPFTASVAEADNVIAAARAAGRHVALNHEFREMPIYRAVRDEIHNGTVGRLTFLQAWQNMNLPPWREPGWRGQLLQRTLYEAGVHLIDYVVAVFDELPQAVSATVSSCGARASQSDAVAVVTLEFSDGRLAQIIQNRLCMGETQYFEVRAECSAASLRASFGGRARVTAGLFRSTRPHARVEFGTSGIAWAEHGTKRRVLARNPRNPGMQATRRVIARTLAAWASGNAPPASAEAARDILRVIAACYHAAATGHRVPLNGPDQDTITRFRMGA